MSYSLKKPDPKAHRSRHLNYAEQQLEQGYLLHVDHDREKSSWRRGCGTIQRCSYRHACRIISQARQLSKTLLLVERGARPSTIKMEPLSHVAISNYEEDRRRDAAAAMQSRPRPKVYTTATSRDEGLSELLQDEPTAGIDADAVAITRGSKHNKSALSRLTGLSYGIIQGERRRLTLRADPVLMKVVADEKLFAMLTRRGVKYVIVDDGAAA